MREEETFTITISITKIITIKTLANDNTNATNATDISQLRVKQQYRIPVAVFFFSRPGIFLYSTTVTKYNTNENQPFQKNTDPD